jgi:tetrahydromethanopterin S-methyltransferase subunit E
MTSPLAPVIVRIVLRYLAGALVAWGLVSPETGGVIVADPDLQALLLTAVGALIAALTEWAYAAARRGGGPT